MIESYSILVPAALAFLGVHAFSSIGAWRGAIVGAIGEQPFRGLFSLASAAALAWLIWAYAQAPAGEPLWGGHPVLRAVTLVLMVPAWFLFVGGITTANPTAVGADTVLGREDPARGVVRITRHPMLWSFGLWGVGHMLGRSDPAALIFFGTFALLAFAGTLLIDRKKAAAGESWGRFAAMTSNLPFAAIAGGRNRLVFGEIGWWRIGLALVLLAAGLYLHAPAFGVSPFPL